MITKWPGLVSLLITASGMGAGAIWVAVMPTSSTPSRVAAYIIELSPGVVGAYLFIRALVERRHALQGWDICLGLLSVGLLLFLAFVLYAFSKIPSAALL